MRVVRGVVTAAALLAAGAAQAQAGADSMRSAFERDFCPGLERLLEAAPDFEGLYNARPAPPWLGFRPGACRAAARSYWCHQSLAPAHLSLDSLAAATAACLPQAVRTKGRWSDDAIFTVPAARIVISESGGPRAHVGRIVTLRIEAADEATKP